MHTRGRAAKQAAPGHAGGQTSSAPVSGPDQILALGAGGLSVVLLVLAACSLALYLPSELPTTGGEEAGAYGAWYVRAGQTLYVDWRRDEARLLIYGPLYYELLGQIARLMGLDRDGLLTLGRATALAAAAGAALLLALLVRGIGGGALASLVALLPLAWLPLTALKFLVSTRPDALALLFSIGAVAAACMAGGRKAKQVPVPPVGPPPAGRRDARVPRGSGFGVRWIVLAAALAVGAAFTKPTALAAGAAVLGALLIGREWRAAALFAGTAAAIGLVGVTGVQAASDGYFLVHLLAAGDAPRDWRYAAELAGGNWQASVIALLMIVLAALLARLRRAGAFEESARRPFDAPAVGRTARMAAVYGPVSLALAVYLSCRQGGDVNYLIEPAAATGWMLGVVLTAAKRPSVPSARRALRLLLVLVAVVSIGSGPLERLHAARREAAQARELAPVYRHVAEWIAQQPRPLLSLEPWLAYRAGVDGFVSDRIAYTSAVLSRPELDVAAQRVEERHFAAIVLYEPVGRAGRVIYQDIPYATPRLREAIRRQYVERGFLLGWYVYGPREEDARGP